MRGVNLYAVVERLLNDFQADHARGLDHTGTDFATCEHADCIEGVTVLALIENAQEWADLVNATEVAVQCASLMLQQMPDHTFEFTKEQARQLAGLHMHCDVMDEGYHARLCGVPLPNERLAHLGIHDSEK